MDFYTMAPQSPFPALTHMEYDVHLKEKSPLEISKTITTMLANFNPFP